MDVDDPNRLDWFLYKKTGDSDARDRLVASYTPLVKYVASRVGAGLPQSVENGDLASYGTFGLLDAIDKFDLERGFKFETYAIARIKGAILDELRSIDWVPRSVRAKQRSVEVATRKLEGDLKRQPTEHEIAKELEIEPSEVRSILAKAGRLTVTSFDETGAEGDKPSIASTVADPSVDIGGDHASSESIDFIRNALAEAANDLDEREQMVLSLYYRENLTLAEVGQVLGVTESRICQIHTKAVLGLRSRITASDLEPA